MNENELKALKGPEKDESIAMVLNQWQEKGFRPDQPLGEYHNFAEAWLDNRGGGWFACMGVKSVEVLWKAGLQAVLEQPRGRPDPWARRELPTRDKTGKERPGKGQKKPTNWDKLLEVLLDRIEGRYSNNHGMEAKELMEWALGKAPRETLENWRDRNGQGLLLRMTRHDYGDKLVSRWVALGLKVDQQSVYEAKDVAVLREFIKQGGDLLTEGEDGEPMWKRLCSLNPALKEEADKIMAERCPEAWQEFSQKKYFERIGRRYTTTDLKSAMRKMPGWEKLVNEEGENALKVAYLQNHKVVTFDEKMPRKYLGLLLQKDKQGRNFWFQFLNRRKAINIYNLQWCVDNLPMENQGEGWLSWIMEPKGRYEGFLNLDNWEAARTLLAQVPPEIWLPQTEAQEQKVAKFIWEEVKLVASEKTRSDQLWKYATPACDVLALSYRAWPGAGTEIRRVGGICWLLSESLGRASGPNAGQPVDMRKLAEEITAGGWYPGMIGASKATEVEDTYGSQNRKGISELLQNKFPEIYARLESNRHKAELEEALPGSNKHKSALRI